MKNRSAFLLAMVFCSGCAHGRRPEEKPARVIPESTAGASPAQTSGVRVNLPYTFTRRGVEVRVYSIEFSADKLVVTTSLRETRGTEVDLEASLLMKAQTTAGDILPFATLGRDGKELSSTIHLAAKEQIPVTLSYVLGGNAGKPLELHFPTGKWWSSVRDSAQ